MDTPLLLFDDARARAWQPFRLTRPVGELRFGCMTLRERSAQAVGFTARAYLGCDDLEGFAEAGAPPIAVRGQFPDSETIHAQGRIVLSSRAVLERKLGTLLPPLTKAWEDENHNPIDPSRTKRVSLRVGEEVVGWMVPPLHPLPDATELEHPGKSPVGESVELPGTVLEWPWNLVEANGQRIAADVSGMRRSSSLFGLTDVRMVGDHQLSIGPDARVEPGVVLDLREGPIRLDANVYVQAPARLTGPLHVGEGTLIFGGSVGHSSIGPVCKVRGEIDSTIMAGYCNKAHDGYLGHALLGRWVNLGAMTTNSDLKNNYSNVRVRLGSDEIDTGLIKVGCFLGDHVKTGIGTLIPTGGIVGAGSNVFGGKILPRYVPPFSWGAGANLVEFRVEELLQVAEVAMGRRDIELTQGMKDLLRRAWDSTRAERQRKGS